MFSWHTVAASFVYVVANAAQANAKLLPLAQNDKPDATLTTSREVTFDPLGVAAVLHNPRASLSVARLYTQFDRKYFTWPHTMMIGASLIPVKVLVEHLTATFQSLHPALSLCTRDTEMLSVVSNMVFRELPLDFGNMWLGDIIAFKASMKPANDFLIVCMDEDYAGQGTDDLTEYDEHSIKRQGPATSIRWLGCTALNLLSLGNGLIIATGIVLSTLSLDIWGLTLFFFYGLHWLAGIAISTTSLVTPQVFPIKEDDTTRYAIYQRPAGGTVVFKGRQDTMEAWARRTWEFKRTLRSNCLHWFWVLSGTVSAICSLACMVNMFGYMQLTFLALLLYASLAEIVATRFARILQGDANANTRSFLVDDNDFRTKGIIRATIEVKPKYRLDGLDWVELKRMPDESIFRDMQRLMSRFNEFQCAVETGREAVPFREPREHDVIEAALREFRINRNEDPKLVERIQKEALEALTEWWKGLKKHDVTINAKEQAIISST